MRYSPDPRFDQHMHRILAKIPSGMADLDECLKTVRRIPAGDVESWRREWLATAHGLRQRANVRLARGHLMSAGEIFLRASEYYRAADYFSPPEENGEVPDSPHRETFQAAMDLIGPIYEVIEFTNAESVYGGYFFSPSTRVGPRPTILGIGPSDGTAEELYAAVVVPTLRRGCNAVPLHPADENVLGQAIDLLVERSDVDGERIALVGHGGAGEIALRFVSQEPRLAAIVADRREGLTDDAASIRRVEKSVEILILSSKERLETVSVRGGGYHFAFDWLDEVFLKLRRREGGVSG